MLAFAEQRNIEVWHARLRAEELRLRLAGMADRQTHHAVKKSIDKALRHDHLTAFDKLIECEDGDVRFTSDPPLLVPVEELLDGDQRARYVEVITGFLEQYRESLSPHLRALVESYRFVHMARKVVGVGSVGTRAWVVLFEGRDAGDPLLLQLKEAQHSVLEPYAGASRVRVAGSPGRRGPALHADGQRQPARLVPAQRPRRPHARLLRAPDVGRQVLDRRDQAHRGRPAGLRRQLRLDPGPGPRPLRRPGGHGGLPRRRRRLRPGHRRVRRHLRRPQRGRPRLPDRGHRLREGRRPLPASERPGRNRSSGGGPRRELIDERPDRREHRRQRRHLGVDERRHQPAALRREPHRHRPLVLAGTAPCCGPPAWRRRARRRCGSRRRGSGRRARGLCPMARPPRRCDSRRIRSGRGSDGCSSGSSPTTATTARSTSATRPEQLGQRRPGDRSLRHVAPGGRSRPRPSPSESLGRTSRSATSSSGVSSTSSRSNARMASRPLSVTSMTTARRSPGTASWARETRPARWSRSISFEVPPLERPRIWPIEPGRSGPNRSRLSSTPRPGVSSPPGTSGKPGPLDIAVSMSTTRRHSRVMNSSMSLASCFRPIQTDDARPPGRPGHRQPTFARPSVRRARKSGESHSWTRQMHLPHRYVLGTMAAERMSHDRSRRRDRAAWGTRRLGTGRAPVRRPRPSTIAPALFVLALAFCATGLPAINAAISPTTRSGPAT